MTAADLQICKRVGAIQETNVLLSDQGWNVVVNLTKAGWDDLVDQSGKKKIFKSLDTVFEALSLIGISQALIVADKNGVVAPSVVESMASEAEHNHEAAPFNPETWFAK